LVAVTLPPGWQQAAAVLGVLQAGAAFLPIDPALPPEQQRALLAFGEVALALTPSGNAADWWPAHVRRVYVDSPPEAGPADPAREPAGSPAHLTYVIPRAGDGPPRGLMIDHRGA